MSYNAKAITLIMGLAMVGGSVGGAVAQTKWQENHPGRANVNSQLKSENQQIHQERKAGDITAAQANAMHREDRQIHHEEQTMAHQDHNNGHLTGAQLQTLKQRENALGAQIKQ